MIKILNVEQIRSADLHTIKHEPIASIDLMERAAKAFVAEFINLVSSQTAVDIICGPGNNGGDGFAIARQLAKLDYQVICYELSTSKLSEDCAVNRTRFLEMNMAIKSFEPGTKFNGKVIIDGLFGSGLSRPISKGPFAQLIETINSSNRPIVSIDIPSGLFADDVRFDRVVRADHTITFQFPKLSFLLPETGNFVGEIHIVDIGLDQDFIGAQATSEFFLEAADISGLLKRRKKFGHKGTYGRVQIAAGSQGKMGAAYLCGKACMRTGAGLLTMNIPGAGEEIIQTSLPEAMVLTSGENALESIEFLSNTDVFCIGPGIGTSTLTSEALEAFLKSAEPSSLVLDADALNIIAKKPELFDHLPEGTILTPHPGEFDRLFGPNENSLEKLEVIRSFSKKTGVLVVSKGAHSVTSDEVGNLYFNSSGNPGMATAGSGDVLAGMIAGLRAQGLNSRDAALAGVYLHGRAGDIAQKKVGEMSLMASDLLKTLPEAISNANNKEII